MHIQGHIGECRPVVLRAVRSFSSSLLAYIYTFRIIYKNHVTFVLLKQGEVFCLSVLWEKFATVLGLIRIDLAYSRVWRRDGEPRADSDDLGDPTPRATPSGSPRKRCVPPSIQAPVWMVSQPGAAAGDTLLGCGSLCSGGGVNR